MIIDRRSRDADRTSARRYRNELVRRRFLLGRVLLRILLEDFTETPAADWTFVVDDNGKPFARCGSDRNGPSVSVSHSGSIVAAAVSDLGALGIDVEHRRDDRSFTALAEWAFGPTERLYAAHSPREFYRIWTLREAMSKATGQGLRLAADGVDRIGSVPKLGVWRRDEDGHIWLLAHAELMPDYSLAIAIRREAGLADPVWSESSIRWLTPLQGDRPEG